MLKKLDLINEFQCSILIENERYFKTKLGGMFTIILMLLSLLCIIGFGKDFVMRSSPTVYFSEIKEENKSIKRKGFKAAIGLNISGGFTFQDLDRLVEIYIVDTDTNPANDPVTTFRYLKSPKCMNMESLNSTYFELKNSFIAEESNYFCFPDELQSNLENTFGNPKFKIWKFEIHYCKNTTENNNHCLSREKIQEKMKEIYIQLIWSNYYIDSSDYQEPVKFSYENMLMIMRGSTLASRQDLLYYKKFEYFSDNGILLEDKIKYEGFYLDKHEFFSYSR